MDTLRSRDPGVPAGRESAAPFHPLVASSGPPSAEKAPRENDASTYRAHSHTRTHAFRKLKKAHVPRRRPGHLGANHKHKRVKHTTADSRARPTTFVPRFTHSSFLTVSLFRSHSRPLSLALSPPLSSSHSPPLSHARTPSSLSLFSHSPSPTATTATVASEARSLEITEARSTQREDSRRYPPPESFFVVILCF